MSKYVFKNPEVEKALRLVAGELGYSDEDFDRQVKIWSCGKTIWLMGEGLEDFDFPSSLLKKVKDFNPDGWNDPDVIPPEDEEDRGTSKIMLIENDDGYPQKGYYDFIDKVWVEVGTRELIECSRYKFYPF